MGAVVEIWLNWQIVVLLFDILAISKDGHIQIETAWKFPIWRNPTLKWTCHIQSVTYLTMCNVRVMQVFIAKISEKENSDEPPSLIC